MPSLVEIGQVVLEKKIFKFPICIFPNYLPLEIGADLRLNKFKFPLLKDAFSLTDYLKKISVCDESMNFGKKHL